MIKYVTRLALALIMATLLGSLSTPALANDNPIDLELGGTGATSWDITSILPGDSGTKTVTLRNAGDVDGFVTIWVSDLVSSEGDNPESETGDTAEPGELDEYLLFDIDCSLLQTSISLPTTIDNLPQTASDQLEVTPLNVGDTVTLNWQWELPVETGNEVQGDSLSFTINYMLGEFPRPPSVLTIIVSPVGSYWAVLRGTLTDMGTASSVDVSFEWGETTAYGFIIAVQTMPRPGAFRATITGLTPTTTYHFRAVAVGDDTSYGLDRSFTTISPPPPGPRAPPRGPPGTTNVRGLVSTDGVFQESTTAVSEDGLCTLTIPEGTVGLTEELEPLAEITMVIMDVPPDPPEDAHIIGLAYDFGPDRATFEPAITLIWSYDPDALPEGVAEEDLVLAYYDEEAGEWVELDGVVDTVNNIITASVPHFTTFAVIGRAPPEEEEVPIVVPPIEEEEVLVPPVEEEEEVVITVTPAPAAFSVSFLSVSPEVEPGEAVAVSIVIANTGGESGSYTVVLKIDGVKEAEETVTIAGGESQDVSFSVTRDEPGDYTVDVDELSGSFTVVLPVEPPGVNWPLIGGIIGGVIVAGLLIYFLVFRRRAYY